MKWLSDRACASALKLTIGSKTRKLSMISISAMKVVSGRRCGRTTERMRCQRLAPSIMARSRVSCGTVCRPA